MVEGSDEDAKTWDERSATLEQGDVRCGKRAIRRTKSTDDNEPARARSDEADCKVVMYSQRAIAHAQLTGSSERNDVV